MFQEFKKFISRGNVLDLAVGVIIGGAFGAVVKSLVADVIMPPIGLLLGGVDFTNLFVVLGEGSYETLDAAKEAGAASVNYGVFFNNVISFLIVAFAVFMMVKALNSAKRKEEAAPAAEPTTKDCPRCLSTIPIKATKCAHCASELG